MVEDAISFWTDIQRYEDMLAADHRSFCFVPLSELYRKLGLLDDAISVAQKGCSVHPDYPQGFLALGTALSDKGEKAEAIKALEQAARLKPDDVKGLQLLGQLYVEEGRTDQARKVLVKLVSRDPGDTESALLLRSLGIAPEESAAGAEEEFLEEADIIEELEPLDEFEEAESQKAAVEVAESFASLEPAPATAAPGDADPFARFEENDDFWAIEATDEPAAPRSPAATAVTGISPAAPALQTGAKDRDPLTTATLAELYVSQGYLDKALVIYRQLLSADPANQPYRSRCAELEKLREQQTAQGATPRAAQPAAAAKPAAAAQVATPAGEAAASLPGDLEAELGCWLQNIRRRRDGV